MKHRAPHGHGTWGHASAILRPSKKSFEKCYPSQRSVDRQSEELCISGGTKWSTVGRQHSFTMALKAKGIAAGLGRLGQFRDVAGQATSFTPCIRDWVNHVILGFIVSVLQSLTSSWGLNITWNAFFSAEWQESLESLKCATLCMSGAGCVGGCR